MSVQEALTKTWYLGSTSPNKVIHRATCRYAKVRYQVLEGLTEDQVATYLIDGDGWAWHKGCGICCPKLYQEIMMKRRDHVRQVAREWLTKRGML